MSENADARSIGTDRDWDVMLQASIRRIIADEGDPAAYLSWARGSLPSLLPDVVRPLARNADVAALWIARAIWNALPLESNGYHPKPLPTPRFDQSCPCGSARPFGRCCDDISTMLEFPTETVWPLLIAARPDEHWIQAARARVLPNIGLFAAADVFEERRRWSSLRAMAEAVFGDDNLVDDAALALLIDPLCNAYDTLGKEDRKRALLERLAVHPLGALRSVANQRLASCLYDSGDRQEAWAALGRAQQAAPNDPAIAGLEISLLAAERLYARARDRAAFWRRRLQRLKCTPADVLDFLDAAQVDPRRALAEVSRDAAPSAITMLMDWIDAHGQRPLPRLAWSAVEIESNDVWLQSAHEPAPCPQERYLAGAWQDHAQLQKPMSVQWRSGDEVQAWRRCDAWLPWLAAHPHALDSFEVLDDVVALLSVIEEPTGLLDNPWAELLVDRGARMLVQHWPRERAGTLPWIITENRPALRLLARAILQRREVGEEVDELVATYLRLNPEDQHGFRVMRINNLLRAGSDAEALDLAQRYAEDPVPEIVFGRVLALFRTGRPGDAGYALADAADELPLVLDYLVRDDVDAPRAESSADSQEQTGQAWIYRESMRDAWLSTEGLMDWLKPLSRKLRSRAEYA